MQSTYEQSRLEAGGHINSGNTINNFHHNPEAIKVMHPELPRCPLPSTRFTGRKDELEQLKRFFTCDNFNRFALIGMGGCGKSQIGHKFMHEYVLGQKMYDPTMVFFVDATTSTTLEEGYASIAKSKGVGSTSKEACLWLSNVQQRAFMLIDNADNPKLDLHPYIPRSKEVHILITTRSRHVGTQHDSRLDGYIDLNALPINEAADLLKETAGLMLNKTKQEDFKALAEELHCYVLALVQAGSCIAFLGLKVMDYLDLFRAQSPNFMDGKLDGVDKNALDGYAKHIFSAWYISYSQLPPRSQKLFGIFAHLHHTGISQDLFERATLRIESYKPSTPLSQAEQTALSEVKALLTSFRARNQSFDALAFRMCIRDVIDLSLIRRHDATEILSLHPLVQDNLRGVFHDHLQTTFLLLAAATHKQGDKVFLYHLAPHVERVLRSSSIAGALDEGQPTMLHPDAAMAFSLCLNESGQWPRAELLQREALGTRTRHLDATNEHCLSARLALALTSRASGQRVDPGAETEGRSLLDDWTKAHGQDCMGAIDARDNLAQTLRDLRRYEEAHIMHMDVLDRRKRVLGEDHPDTVTSLYFIAVALFNLDRYEEAEKVGRKVLHERTRLLGEDHPDTVTSLSALAFTLRSLSRFDEARPMIQKVVDKQKLNLGEDHPDTLRAMGRLSNVLHSLARYTEVEELQQDVLKKRQRVLGKEHPDTLMAQYDLAQALERLGRRKEARALLENTIQRFTATLGASHSRTALCMKALQDIDAAERTVSDPGDATNASEPPATSSSGPESPSLSVIPVVESTVPTLPAATNIIETQVVLRTSKRFWLAAIFISIMCGLIVATVSCLVVFLSFAYYSPPCFRPPSP